jgi:hypothetical protein
VVSLADGSVKFISQVRVGDMVCTNYNLLQFFT